MGYKMKGFPEFLLKKQKGPVETKNKPSRKEIEKSFEIGEKLENFDTPSDIIDYQMKIKSPAKQKAKTGHGAKGFPDIVYKEDGTAKRTSQIDEEMLDLRPSIGPKGKFVNYTKDDGTKIKYYYKPPAGSRDKQIEKQGENIDEVD